MKRVAPKMKSSRLIDLPTADSITYLDAWRKTGNNLGHYQEGTMTEDPSSDTNPSRLEGFPRPSGRHPSPWIMGKGRAGKLASSKNRNAAKTCPPEGVKGNEDIIEGRPGKIVLVRRFDGRTPGGAAGAREFCFAVIEPERTRHQNEALKTAESSKELMDERGSGGRKGRSDDHGDYYLPDFSSAQRHEGQRNRSGEDGNSGGRSFATGKYTGATSATRPRHWSSAGGYQPRVPEEN